MGIVINYGKHTTIWQYSTILKLEKGTNHAEQA